MTRGGYGNKHILSWMLRWQDGGGEGRGFRGRASLRDGGGVACGGVSLWMLVALLWRPLFFVCETPVGDLAGSRGFVLLQ